MDKKAVVVAVKKRKAVILVSGGIFQEVRNQNYAVGQKIIRKSIHSRQTSHVLRRGLMIAACLVLLLSSSILAIAKYVPWVSVTVAYGEAEVQYQLNALNEVLSASSDTEEGKAVLASVSPAPYEPIGSVIEDSLSVMQSRQGSEAKLYVEIVPRFGDGRRAEEVITVSVNAQHMEMILERKPWNESGQPHERPGQDRQDNVPSVQPDEPTAPAEGEQNMPFEGQQPPADSGQQLPMQGQPAFDDNEQSSTMNGQPAFGDGEQNKPTEEQPAHESKLFLSMKGKPERDKDGLIQPADGQTLPASIKQGLDLEEPSASPDNGQNVPIEGQLSPKLPSGGKPEGVPEMNSQAPEAPAISGLLKDPLNADVIP